ncbi:hypothetical protein EJB05_01191 [Eragrostis curvula]|uniref:Uncharacterized protein n=1 Tax=Eragrostis curvula TaxID=38414 RepID=A0A5J9WMC2_9POAL|nr:hypothetical protein EJB05_01191 [Eragrostis curvula]
MWMGVGSRCSSSSPATALPSVQCRSTCEPYSTGFLSSPSLSLGLDNDGGMGGRMHPACAGVDGAMGRDADSEKDNRSGSDHLNAMCDSGEDGDDTEPDNPRKCKKRPHRHNPGARSVRLPLCPNFASSGPLFSFKILSCPLMHGFVPVVRSYRLSEQCLHPDNKQQGELSKAGP